MAEQTSPRSRGRAPESIRAFERAIWRASPLGIPDRCRCTWVPTFTRELRPPGGPHDTRPYVWCYQVDGLALKFTDVDCPALPKHG